MGYALDIVILGVAALFVMRGVRRGFVRSAAHFVGAAISAWLAAWLGGAAARWIFDSLFRPALVERIGESIAATGTQDAAAAAQGIFSSLPDFIVRALEEAGVTAASVSQGLVSQSGQVAELVTDLLSPVFVSFLKVLAMIVLFSLFMIVVRAGAGVLSSAFRLPILYQVNGLLGGVFGFFLAALSFWIVIAVVGVFTPMLDGDTQAKINMALEQSYLAGAVVRWNPLQSVFF